MAIFSKIYNKVTFVLKALYVLSAGVVAASYGVVASIVFAIFRRRGLAQWSTGKLFYALVKPVMGIDIKFVGNDNYQKYFTPKSLWSLIKNNAGSTATLESPDSDLFLRPCVLVSNHQSILDVYIIGKIFPPFCSVTAKRSLQFVPFLGWYMSLSGTVFLNRKNSISSIQTLNGAVDHFLTRDRQSIYMFPEGTRSYTPVPTIVTPLKKGAFHLAVQAQIPVVPIAISNTSNIYDSTRSIFSSGTIKVKICDPIPTAGMTRDDISDLTLNVEKVLSEAINELGYSEVPGKDTSDKDTSTQVKDVNDEQQPLLDSST